MKTVACNLLLIIAVVQVLEAFRVFSFNDEEKECIKQSGADADRIQHLYSRYATPENDTQFNHFTECLWKKSDFLTENGDINYEKLKNFYRIDARLGEDNPTVLRDAKKLVFDAVTKCESNHDSLKSDTPAKTAVKVQNCIADNFSKGTRVYYPEH
ncbi:hypothetical protein ILUMI_11468 [Ignelater luminosus]|uniref:Uncharacterized protein n=1 Tax=Ignelater luminosus TaxID=2038154 RepID=A0A8K0D1D1_IGNLU|nr:hypothetical protein ILUMI_11468 [Ignelater luminosus]